MTPTPEQIAALAAAVIKASDDGKWSVYWTTGGISWEDRREGAAGLLAAPILAALPDWTLVPTGEVERLGGIEEAARAVCESPCHTPELEPTVVFDALRAALAGDAP